MRFVPTLIMALTAALPLSASAQSTEEKKPVYKMKADEPHVGTHLKRDEAISRIPYDKTYAQLSDEDKRILRAVYEHMGPDDEPPFPIRGYKTIFKALSKIQDKLRVQGLLDIAVTVDAEGVGTSVTIYASPDPEMTRVVAALMMLEKYKPALCGGKPCVQEFPLRAKFTMSH